MNYQLRSFLSRLAAVAAIVVGWVIVSGHAPWSGAFWRWHGDFSKPLAVLAAVLLVGYIGALIFLVVNPRRHRSPEDAMANGCVSAVCLALGGIIIVLLVGMHFHLSFVVRTITVGTLLISVPVLGQLAWLGIGNLRKRTAEHQTWIRPDQITRRLSGHTHVIDRHSSDPPRKWRELRYYSPDGRMPGYKEENGQLEAYPAKVTWRAEGGYLVTISPEHLDKPMKYTLMSQRDGTISYYLNDESSPQNNQLLFRTVEIREGEPVVSATAEQIDQ